MGVSLSGQAQGFFAALLLGVSLSLLYDLLRAVRLRRAARRRLTGALDALYCVLAALLTFLFALRVGGGELRLYMLTGMLLGAVLWFLLLSPLLRPVWDFWAASLRETGRLLWSPLALLGRLIKKWAAAVKKGFSFCVKCATIRVDGWKSHHSKEKTPQQKGGRPMAREKRQKKTKKRPGTMVLLVIAVLVAVLGIQIVRVYQQLKVARQEEAALSQQLTQQQQENDALRSDLEKKGDESFIKALARDLLGLADEGERIFYDVND